MNKNHSIVEAIYEIDFGGFDYAVIHSSTLKDGKKEYRVYGFNKLKEAREEFNQLVELEKWSVEDIKDMTREDLSHWQFVSGKGAHKNELAFGVYDMRNRFMISEVVLMQNPKIA